MTATVAENYAYWQENGQGWFAEYARRKSFIPYFHIQEIFLSEYVGRHAPAKVLEYGCGVGRHLRNLSRISRIDVFGYDQSPTMIAEMGHWAAPEWVSEHVRLGPPVGRLPCADGEFDIVFTCEVLVHTRPEDLDAVLAEILRVSRGKILHIEPELTVELVANAHNGCWGHDLVAAYRRLGVSAEPLPKLFGSQTPVQVSIAKGEDGRPSPFDEVTCDLFRRMEADLGPLIDRAVGEGFLDSPQSPDREIVLEDVLDPASGALRLAPGMSRSDLLASLEVLARRIRDLDQVQHEAAALRTGLNLLAAKLRPFTASADLTLGEAEEAGAVPDFDALVASLDVLAGQVRDLEQHQREAATLRTGVTLLASKLRPFTGSADLASDEVQGPAGVPDFDTLARGLTVAAQERAAAKLELELQRDREQALQGERDQLARKLEHLENRLRYIETGTSYPKLRRLKQLPLASGILRALGVGAPPIKIEVLSQSHDEARGSEVWLRFARPDPDAPLLPWSLVTSGDGWRFIEARGCTEDLALRGTTGMVVIPGGADPELSFMCHPWSGRIRITWRGRQHVVDLYNRETTDITLRLRELMSS
jgi:SAM-dependent methyltransferase